MSARSTGMRSLPSLCFASFLSVVLAGCAASAPPPAAAMAPVAAAPVPVLGKSLYGKDPSGSLGEDDLQTILGTAIDLQLPARVGVVPLAEPFDPKGPVAITTRHVAAHDLALGITGSKWFSQVSDVSTDLPNVGGLEGLRVIAARYRVRYLLLFSQKFEDATHLNGWAWTYPTLIGMFVTPGVTVESRGVVQADLLDVRTGTILFTAVEPVSVKEHEWIIGAARAHREAQNAAASAAAKTLAKHVLAETEALVKFADEAAQTKAKTRIVPAPVQAAAASPHPTQTSSLLPPAVQPSPAVAPVP